jgi:hypothetical protein
LFSYLSKIHTFILTTKSNHCTTQINLYISTAHVQQDKVDASEAYIYITNADTKIKSLAEKIQFLKHTYNKSINTHSPIRIQNSCVHLCREHQLRYQIPVQTAHEQ